MVNFKVITLTTICLLMTIFTSGQNYGEIYKKTKIQYGNDRFGDGVANIGDLNQDGIPDLAVGAPDDFNNEVYILFLDTFGNVKSSTVISSNKNGFNVNLGSESGFGRSITSLGDLNNDGNIDLAIGTPSGNYGGTKKGGIWILFLNDDGTVKKHQLISDNKGGLNTNINSDDNFGYCLSDFPDQDNNEIQDLLVGSPDRNSGQGSFFLLSINENGEVVNEKEYDNTSSNFSSSATSIGRSISNIGDLNNDGNEDLILGDPLFNGNDQNEGAAWIVFMNESQQIKGYQKVSQESNNFTDTLHESARFGTSVEGIGDLNGDSVNDIVIGSPWVKYNNTTSDLLTGKIWILFMKSDGTVKDDQIIGNNHGKFKDTLITDDQFGASIAGIMDLNDDQIPELAAGSPGRGDDQNVKGTAYILFLNGVPQTPEDTSSGLEPNMPFKRLNTYPNPVTQSQNLTLSLPSTLPEGQKGTITLFDMEGQLVRRKDFTYQDQQELQLTLGELQPGSYQLFLKAGDFQGFSRVVVGGR